MGEQQALREQIAQILREREVTLNETVDRLLALLRPVVEAEFQRGFERGEGAFHIESGLHWRPRAEASEAALARVREALRGIVDACDDPNPDPNVSLALSLVDVLPAAREALKLTASEGGEDNSLSSATEHSIAFGSVETAAQHSAGKTMTGRCAACPGDCETKCLHPDKGYGPPVPSAPPPHKMRG